MPSSALQGNVLNVLVAVTVPTLAVLHEVNKNLTIAALLRLLKRILPYAFGDISLEECSFWVRTLGASLDDACRHLKHGDVLDDVSIMEACGEERNIKLASEYKRIRVYLSENYKTHIHAIVRLRYALTIYRLRDRVAHSRARTWRGDVSLCRDFEGNAGKHYPLYVSRSWYVESHSSRQVQ